jgi:hypothetical protein
LLDDNSGRISAKIDGQPANFEGQGPVLDLHTPYRVLSRQFTLELREYTAGEHTITITFEGAPGAEKGPMIGLDYLAIQPG